MRIASTAAVAACLGLLLAAAAPADRPPAAVERAAFARLRGAGADDTALAAAGLFRPAGGGWIVDYAVAAPPRLCGTGGCPLQVWAPVRSGRLRVVFDRQVLGWSMTDAPAGLVVDLHGVHCGGTGSDACRRALVWRGGRLVAAPAPAAP